MKELAFLLFIAFAGSVQMPTFEVASVRLNRSTGGVSSIRLSVGLIRMENVSLKKLTLAAFDIPDDREYALVGPDLAHDGTF